MKKTLLAITALFTLSGCATIIDHRKDEVQVRTTPGIKNTRCMLQNDQGRYTAHRLPGTVTVNRSWSDLEVRCQAKREDGKQYVGKQKLGPGLNPWTLANVLAGGLIGLGVDMYTGAIANYDEEVVVPMRLSGRLSGQTKNAAGRK